MISPRRNGRRLDRLSLVLGIALMVESGMASGTPLVVPVAPLELDGAGMAHPLAVARARSVLKRVRSDFAGSRFDRCATTLEVAERELARHLRTMTDLSLMKRINQWWGLCLTAAGDQPGAQAAFGRAAGLPGEEPEQDVFSPPMLEAYRAAARPRSSCAWPDRGPNQQLDGKAVASGSRVEFGEHYLIELDGTTTRSGRVAVGREPADGMGCVVSPSLLEPAPPVAGISAEEAADASFLGDVGRSAGVSRLVVVAAVNRTVTTSLVDVESSTIVERKERVIPLGRTAAAVAREQLDFIEGGPLPALRMENPPSSASGMKEGSRPWYSRWWVWGAVIGVVAASATAIALAGRADQPRSMGEPRFDVVF